MLVLRRKTRTHLDSILKSKDITLLTKVCIVKAMVFMLFLIVVYRYKSWIIKNAECQRTDTFKLWCWRRFLRVPWTTRRPTLNIHWKDWRTDAEAPMLWLPNAKSWLTGKYLDEGKRRRGQQRMRCFDSMMHSMGISLSKLWETVKYIWEPGMLQSMGLQRVSHNLATEKQQQKMES